MRGRLGGVWSLQGEFLDNFQDFLAVRLVRRTFRKFSENSPYWAETPPNSGWRQGRNTSTRCATFGNKKEAPPGRLRGWPKLPIHRRLLLVDAFKRAEVSPGFRPVPGSQLIPYQYAKRPVMEV